MIRSIWREVSLEVPFRFASSPAMRRTSGSGAASLTRSRMRRYSSERSSTSASVATPSEAPLARVRVSRAFHCAFETVLAALMSVIVELGQVATCSHI